MAEANASANCIFCAIVAGRAPAHRVYEDERLLVFMDLFPAHEGHTLIIPKRHGETLFDVEREDLDAIIRVSVSLGEALKRVFSPDGLAVMQLNGEAAGQTSQSTEFNQLADEVRELSAEDVKDLFS